MLMAHRRNGVVCFASKWVAYELLSASVGDDERDATSAWHGVRALVELARLWDGSPFIPFARSRLETRVLAMKERRQDEKLIAMLGSLLLEVAAATSRPAEGWSARCCQEIRRFVTRRECGYGQALANAANQAAALMHEHTTVPHGREAALAAARFLRDRGSRFTSEILATLRDGFDDASDPELLAEEVKWMEQNATTTVAFVHRQLVLSVGGQINPLVPSHANSVWDAHVCALIDARSQGSRDPRFSGASVCVVTSEAQILAAAEGVGHRAGVRTLEEHCGQIGVSPFNRGMPK